MTAVQPTMCDDQTEPLSVDAHQAAVAGPASGATVVFSGVVRDHDDGRRWSPWSTSGTRARPRCCGRAGTRSPPTRCMHAVAVSHRIGAAAVGDAALVAAVSAAHRAEAFEACARLVDIVKERLPIWKRQVFPDGADEWVNCP